MSTRKRKEQEAEAEQAAQELRAIKAAAAYDQAWAEHQARETLTYLGDWAWHGPVVQRAAVILRAQPEAPALERLFGIKEASDG